MHQEAVVTGEAPRCIRSILFDSCQGELFLLMRENRDNRSWAMPSFDVRFIKTVCDDAGHEHRACQAVFSVDADSLSEAVDKAEADFCRQRHVRDWTMFADAVECRAQAIVPRALAS